MVKHYVNKELYKGKVIKVNVADASFKDYRYTKIYCPDYSDTVITLNNASNIQIERQIYNFFVIAKERIDEDSFSNRIKRLFK